MSVLGLAQLAALTVIAFGALSAAVSGVAYPPLRRWLHAVAPPDRANVLVVWSAAPILAGILLTVVCFVPSLRAVGFGDGGDHCLGHDDHHVHLCLLHPPHAPGGDLGWFLIALLGAAGILRLVRYARRRGKSRRALAALLDSADADASREVLWVASPSPLALVAGFMKPRVIVADVLRDRLSPAFVDAIIAHEFAHRRRRDVWRLAIASVLASSHLPPIRRRLLRDLTLACEQAADGEAAVKVGDPLPVAEAILAVERLAVRSSSMAPAMSPTFRGGQVTARIDHLLGNSPVNPLSRVWTSLLGSVIALLVFAGADALHHFAETILAPLTF